MIPKQIFFFWANDKLSWLRYMTLFSFRKLNPDWSMQLYYTKQTSENVKTWDSHEQQDFFNYNEDDNYLDRLGQLDIEIIQWKIVNPNDPKDESWEKIGSSHKSNFLKWQLLGTIGGIYADMDILFIKPIDELHSKIAKDYDTGICFDKYLSIGFLASSPGNQFFYNLFLRAFDQYTPHRYQCVGVENIYDYLSDGRSWKNEKELDWEWILRTNLLELLSTKNPSMKIYNFPMDIVYPWKYNEMDTVFRRPYREGLKGLTHSTIGIHWYAGDPISQEYNNKLTETNYKEFNNLATYFAEKILEHSEKMHNSNANELKNPIAKENENIPIEDSIEGNKKRILILGMGDLFLKDEGVGVHVVERLKGMELPSDVEVLDGGNISFDLLSYIEGRRRVIVIDALKGGGAPGTLYHVTDKDFEEKEELIQSGHSSYFMDALKNASLLGTKPGEIIFIGVEPKEISGGLTLSTKLKRKIPQIIEVIMEQVKRPLKV